MSMQFSSFPTHRTSVFRTTFAKKAAYFPAQHWSGAVCNRHEARFMRSINWNRQYYVHEIQVYKSQGPVRETHEPLVCFLLKGNLFIMNGGFRKFQLSNLRRTSDPAWTYPTI